jgi:hypothetical protein
MAIEAQLRPISAPQLSRKARRDIQRKLLYHYLIARQKVWEVSAPWEIKEVLWHYGVQYGVCYCASNVFSVDVYNEAWVVGHAHYKRDKRHTGRYWGPIPYSKLWFATAGGVEDILEPLPKLDVRKIAPQEGPKIKLMAVAALSLRIKILRQELNRGPWQRICAYFKGLVK